MTRDRSPGALVGGTFAVSCPEANEEQKTTVTTQTLHLAQHKSEGGKSFIANHPSDRKKDRRHWVADF
jgi:hypothetical protein